MTNKYLSLKEAANSEFVPGRPSANAIWRWARRGVKSRTGERVKLEHVRAGGKIFVTPDGLSSFFSRLAAADDAYFSNPGPVQVKISPTPDSKCRKKRIDAAKKRLKAAGIM